MNLFIGIDPSINSTGICIEIFDGDNLIFEHFYIIRGHKLTKKEKNASEEYKDNFTYIIYEHSDTRVDDNHLSELFKTYNIISIKRSILDILIDLKEQFDIQIMTIVQEGISYGSTLRTKSVFDLAGLNYVIRDGIIEFDIDCEINYIIAPPSEIKKFATGKGNANKEMMLLLFNSIYDFGDIKQDDIADAYFMCKYGIDLTHKT